MLMKKLSLQILFILCAISIFAQNITFKSSNEFLEIKGKKITYSVTSYKYPNPVSATPSSSETRNVYKNMGLPSSIMKKLKRVIQTSNFYQLPAECGASAKERFYPETLEISLKNKSHKVFYRSNPEYPAPAGYEKLKAEIFNIIDQIK